MRLSSIRTSPWIISSAGFIVMMMALRMIVVVKGASPFLYGKSGSCRTDAASPGHDCSFASPGCSAHFPRIQEAERIVMPLTFLHAGYCPASTIVQQPGMGIINFHADGPAGVYDMVQPFFRAI